MILCGGAGRRTLLRNSVSSGVAISSPGNRYAAHCGCCASDVGHSGSDDDDTTSLGSVLEAFQGGASDYVSTVVYSSNFESKVSSRNLGIC